MATEKRVFFIPGFMGSALLLRHPNPQAPHVPGRTEVIWLDLNGILGGDKYSLMGLPPQEGKALEVGGMIHFQGYDGYYDYFNNPRNWPQNWQHVIYAYDWRLSIKDTATALAQRIAKEGGPPGYYSLVGHSMGGAIAVSTWAVLKAMGKESLIGRVVTLVGVVWGSYSTQLSWAEYEDTLNLFSIVPQVTAWVPGVRLFHRIPPYEEIYGQLLNKFVQWPGTYDMSPNPACPDDAEDTYRYLWYDPDAWAGAHVNPYWTLAEESRTNYHAWRAKPENIVPRSVCVHYVAGGLRTAVRLSPSAFHGGRPGIFAGRPLPFQQRVRLRQQTLPQFQYGDGDNRLTVAQQHFAGNHTIRISGAHASVQNQPAFLHSLVNTLRDPIPGTDSPPVTVAVPRQWPALVLEERTIEPVTAIADAYAATPQVVPSSPRRTVTHGGRHR